MRPSKELPLPRDERPERPPWWPTAVSVGSSVIGSLLAITLSLTVQARAAERGREAKAELERQDAKIRDSVCGIVVSLDNNYRENTPATQLGRENADDIRDLRVVLGCPPP